MVQLILHCNYTVFAHVATELRSLPTDRHAPSLIMERTHPRERKCREQRNQEFKRNTSVLNHFKKPLTAFSV